MLVAAAQPRRTFEGCVTTKETSPFEALAAEPAADASTLPVAALRERFDQLADRVVDRTIDRLPVPGLLARPLRGRLRRALGEDFVTDCERRGVSRVGGRDVASWLLGGGLSVVTDPFGSQLSLWRTLVLGTLGVLAAVPLVLALT